MDIVIFFAVVAGIIWFLFWLHKYVGSFCVGGILGAIASVPWHASAIAEAQATNDIYRIAMLETTGGRIGHAIPLVVIFGLFAVLVCWLKTRKPKSVPSPAVVETPKSGRVDPTL